MMLKKAPLWFLITALLFPSQAWAVGSGAFENASFSPRSLAEGNAVVAQADEPAAISYNPAGITQLKGVQVQANAAFISLITRQSNGGNSTYSAGTVLPVPSAYLSVNPGKILNDRLALGVGMDSPFGLVTDYDSNHPAVHYTGYANYLKMYAIKPVAAIKLHEKLSIAAGPMYYRIFDFGAVLAYPNVLLGAGLPDGQLRLNTSGNAWGWHLGILSKLHKKHQLGFYFRSGVNVHTTGGVEVERSFLRGNFTTGARTKINLPLNMTWAYAFKPNDKTTLETDLGWTKWSTFKRTHVHADLIGSAGDDAILAAVGAIDRDYVDSFTLHLGGNHKLTDKFTLRGGWMFFWTPIPKHTFTPAIPDSNSMALSAGFSYDLWKWLTFDMSYYTRIWFTRDVDNGVSEVLGTTVDGHYTTFGQELFVGLTYKWDEIFGKSAPKEKDEKEDEMAKEILGVQEGLR